MPTGGGGPGRQDPPAGQYGPPAGWYPDPGGSGQLRYWDGVQWTAQTSRRRAHARSAVIAALVAVILLVVGVVGVVRLLGRGGNEITDNPPTSTVSGWDDGATPTPTPSGSPSRSLSPTPDPSATRPAGCDANQPNRLRAPPADSRVHGGPLSYPTSALPDWSGPSTEQRIPYGRDAWSMYMPITTEERGWASSATVGIATAPAAIGSSGAVRLMLQCVLTSDLYVGIAVRLDSAHYTKITVDGATGTRADAVISFDDPTLHTKGSRLWVIVLDTKPATFFFAATPKENDAHIGQVNATVGKLTVD